MPTLTRATLVHVLTHPPASGPYRVLALLYPVWFLLCRDAPPNFFLARETVEQARAAGKLQVLDVSNKTVRDVTGEYQR